jgi:predicted  nucleic acid-binding Zn-ribbon protein
MFRCERCGSSYSPVHMAAMANCPRCEGRDGVSAPLYFKPFRLHNEQPRPAEAREGTGARPAQLAL